MVIVIECRETAVINILYRFLGQATLSFNYSAILCLAAQKNISLVQGLPSNADLSCSTESLLLRSLKAHYRVRQYSPPPKYTFCQFNQFSTLTPFFITNSTSHLRQNLPRGVFSLKLSNRKEVSVLTTL